MPQAVAVIVLNFNGRELLDVVLPSVRAQTRGDFELTVVDNGSSDDSVHHLHERWPEANVLALPENVGVAAALNRGIEATEGTLVALLNNDIELAPTWLEELLGALEQHPEAASVSGKMLQLHRRDLIDAAGDVFRWSSACINRGAGEQDRGQYDRPEAVFSACAGAALYRRRAFEEVGLFDEDFFAYLEDIDWGFRAQLAGFTSWYVPAALAYHVGAATTSRDSRRYGSLQRRNQIWVVVKNYPARSLVRHAPKIALRHLAWVVASIRDRVFWSHMLAWWQALRGLPSMLRKRRRIQSRRRVDVAYLDSLIAPEPWGRGSVSERIRSTIREAAPLFARRRSARSGGGGVKPRRAAPAPFPTRAARCGTSA